MSTWAAAKADHENTGAATPLSARPGPKWKGVKGNPVPLTVVLSGRGGQQGPRAAALRYPLYARFSAAISIFFI